MAVGSFEETVAARLGAVERRLDDLIAQDRPNSGTTGYFDFIAPPSGVLYLSGSWLEIGAQATANGFSYIDLHGANPTYPDFADRWIRGSAGANAQAGFVHRGTGTFYFQNIENAGFEWYVGNTVKMRLAWDGSHVRLDSIDTFYTDTGNLNIRPQNGSGEGGQLTLLGSTGAYVYFYIDNYNNTYRVVDGTNGVLMQLASSSGQHSWFFNDNSSGLRWIGSQRYNLVANGYNIASVHGGSYPGFYIDYDNRNTGTITYGLRFGSENSGVGIASKRDAGGNQFGIDFFTGYAARWRITSGGNLGAGTGIPTYRLQLDTDSAGKPGTSTWSVVSDPGTKEDVQPFAHGLDALLAFPHPVTFYYNGNYGSPRDGVEYVGYMADEVQRVAPKMVITTDYVNEETGAVTPVRYTNISALTPMMHNAILDLAARVLTLERMATA